MWLGFHLVTSASAADEAFDAYLKRSANPANLGLREDGRFYPYASPVGRRIGYRQMVTNKKLFRDGWSEEEARQAFALQIAEVESQWAKRLEVQFSRKFDELPVESREILVDFGVSEGVKQVSPEFVQVAIDLDWERILLPEFYARHEAVWPNTERNQAFYQRWAGKAVAK